MFKSKISRDWLWMDCRLSLGNKIRCIQALSNTTPNQINKMRREKRLKVVDY